MSFESPGAWGVTWEDLAKLDYDHHGLWKHMANVFLFWCRNGVDGFRCDAGYKVPVPVWEYIVAKVRQEYPDTVFMLEGLGGKPETTESLLSDANIFTDLPILTGFGNSSLAMSRHTCLTEISSTSATAVILSSLSLVSNSRFVSMLFSRIVLMFRVTIDDTDSQCRGSLFKTSCCHFWRSRFKQTADTTRRKSYFTRESPLF